MAFYNDSKFNMWRACIAVVWLDKRVDATEKSWISEKIKSLKFTQEQADTLENDLKNGVQFIDVANKITDKKDKAFLCHQIRVISNLDGEYSEEEIDALDAWRESVLSNVNLTEQLIKIQEIDDMYTNYYPHLLHTRLDLNKNIFLRPI